MSDACEDTVLEIEKPFLIVEFCDPCPVLIELTEKFLEVVFPCQLTINKTFTGGDTEAIICEIEAATAINVNRVLVIRTDGKVEHADKDTISHGLDIIGMSKQSVTIGQLVQIVKFGKLTGASIGTPGDNFWLGNNGNLISALPLTGNSIAIGKQMTASEFLVRIGEPLKTKSLLICTVRP